MTPTLPYDVWCLVGKYIPQRNLVRLYGVNEAFFDLAMNQQYREVVIDHSKDEYVESRLSFMGPLVLKRVRSLIVRPLSYDKPSNLKKNKFEKLKNYLTPSGKRSLELAQFQTELQRRIEQMSQLTSLTIGRYPHHDLEMFKFITPLIQTAWMAHGNRLTSLTLSVPLEALSMFEPIPPLNALAELNIILYLEYNTTFYDEILVSLAGFIGLHASSLTNFSIDTPSSLIDPLHLFSNIPILPHLTKFSLNMWLERLRPEYYTHADCFLRKHARFLTEFKLHFWGPNTFDVPPAPDLFFTNPIFQVELPSLKYLDIGLCRWSEELDQSVKGHLVQYLRRVQSSLIKVSLSGYVLTYNQVEAIVGVLGGQNSPLRSLDIHMYFVSCSLLDLLFNQLPKLHTLELRFDALLSRDDGGWNPNYYWNGYDARAAAFVKDMEDRKYPEWGLRHLTVKPLYWGSKRWKEYRDMLAAALPAVVLFNGGSEEEFNDAPVSTRSQEL